MNKQNFTQRQIDNNWAIYLPAASGSHTNVIGKNRYTPGHYSSRMTGLIKDPAELDWTDSTHGRFQYRWTLYSAGHANLDLSNDSPGEMMFRKREPGSFLLGDSGGFQIFKGLWPGDWRARSGCMRADKKRRAVLQWLDGMADYGMILDIPTNTALHDLGRTSTCITTYAEAVEATQFNNEFFIHNRQGHQNGGTRLLNVLQGGNHTEAADWYKIMKDYCDPHKYPDRHFDGWALAGQHKCDIHLVLKRLVQLRHDGMLQQGVHDWLHLLGNGRIDWSLMLTDLQKMLREFVNPDITISFDSASPFIQGSKAAWYCETRMQHLRPWSINVERLMDDRSLSADSRLWSQAVVDDGLVKHFDNTVITDGLRVKDVCVLQPGQTNRHGKVSSTSWDSVSYAIVMAHNTCKLIDTIQSANEQYEAGSHWPKVLWNEEGDHAKFKDIIYDIFSTNDRRRSENIIEKYSRYWSCFTGPSGLTKKKTTNSLTMFAQLFDDNQQDPFIDNNLTHEI